MLEAQLSAAEDGEVGDALNVIAGGQLRVLFGIHFEDEGLAGEVAGGLGDMRSGHAAGSAPGGPEIHENRNFGVAEDLVELGGTDGEGLGDGWEGIFAGAAAACVGQVTGGDAIGLTTGWAGADDGHGVGPGFQ